jgi:regulator of protease activity HflC (stomatin/prohibitin superfamily)
MKSLRERVLDLTFWIVRAVSWALSLALHVLRSAASRSILRVGGLGALHAGLFLGVCFLCFQRVVPGQVGVRSDQLGSRGVEPLDRGPGLHGGLRWVQAWHLLDARLHVAGFGLPADPGSAPALELRSRDGNLVTITAAVVYRIRPGEGWRLVAAGLEHGYASLARAAAESVLRAELAGLSSAELADSNARSACAARVQTALAERLAPLFLQAEAVQLHSVDYWAEYDKSLGQERFARESARLSQALARLEAEKRGDTTAEEIEAEEKRLRAEGDRRLEDLRSQALLEIARVDTASRGEAARLRSTADADYERDLAAGTLALERAQAERDRALGAVLAGEGGRLWLAREAARSLKIGAARLDASDPRLPPLVDLDAWVALFLGRE